ncbi:hypothetical protein [Cellulomonas hominis]
MARRRGVRGTRVARGGCGALVAVLLLVAAVGAVVLVLNRVNPAPTAADRCAATIDGTAWSLSPEQADNAALLGAVALRRGLPARAVTIAIATSLQESKLINIDYGDRDSVGLFQQRPSQGWGTVEEIMDPVYSTGKFYDGLVQVVGYQDLPITEAAQAVQRSGFPDAYAQHEGRARAWASALTGWSPAALTCSLAGPDAAGSVDGFTARVVRDHGELPLTVVEGSGTADDAEDGGPTITLDARAVGGGTTGDDTRAGWALGQWAVAVADGQQVVAVTVADLRWTRADDAWAATGTPLGPGEVQVTLAG